MKRRGHRKDAESATAFANAFKNYGASTAFAKAAAHQDEARIF